MQISEYEHTYCFCCDHLNKLDELRLQRKQTLLHSPILTMKDV